MFVPLTDASVAGRGGPVGSRVTHLGTSVDALCNSAAGELFRGGLSTEQQNRFRSTECADWVCAMLADELSDRIS